MDKFNKAHSSFGKVNINIGLSEELINSDLDKELYDVCEEAETFNELYDKELCDVCVEVDNRFNEQQRPERRKMSEQATDIEDHDVKRTAYEAEASTAEMETEHVDKKTKNCSTCQVSLSKRYFANHLKSNAHTNNILKAHPILPNVAIAKSTFGVITYKISSEMECGKLETPELFLKSVKHDILHLVEESIQKHAVFKVGFIMHVDFVHQIRNIVNCMDFQTCYYIISRGDDLNILLSDLNEKFTNKVKAFEIKDRFGLQPSSKVIKRLDMNVQKFNPIRETITMKL